MLTAIPCTMLCGGTSKGLYFDVDDLPADRKIRDKILLAAMGSPEFRQIDGMGGAHPRTSKVAVLSRSMRDDANADYLFLQVAVDQAEVSDAQSCGNILAGVGPWAIENKFVEADGDVTPAALEADEALKARIEKIRLEIGPRMNLGDVAKKTLPKMSLVVPPRSDGATFTRTFIPHRVHEAIGVVDAVSVTTACVVPGSVAAGISEIDDPTGPQEIEVEHPSGFFRQHGSQTRRQRHQGGPVRPLTHRTQVDTRRGLYSPRRVGRQGRGQNPVMKARGQ